jgi:hypothetical protein
MSCRYLAIPALALVLSGPCIAGSVDPAPSAEAAGSAFNFSDGARYQSTGSSNPQISLPRLLLATYKAALGARGTPADGGTAATGSTGVPGFDSSLRWQSSLSIAGSRVWSRFIGFTTTGINVRLPLN